MRKTVIVAKLAILAKIAKVAILATLATLASCNTDELCNRHPHIGEFIVKYDWSKCPDAQPRSMASYFYDRNGEQEKVRFGFTGRDGGNAHLLCGEYHAIGVNSDHEDWARIRNDHDIEQFEIYTDDVYNLEALGISVRSLPRVRGGEPERMARTPGGPIWNSRQNDITIVEGDGTQTVTFHPEEATCRYTVTIEDVENLQYLHGASIDGTISGMAEGFLHGSHSPSGVPVTMTYLLTPDIKSNSIRATFFTFGRCADRSVPHTVTAYVIFDDGQAGYYTFDVTSQVLDAPDPHNVDIVIKGLKLPKPIVNGGGFKPNVIDWIDETEEIKM